MTKYDENGFPINNVGNDSLSDEFPFGGNGDVKRGSGISALSTRGFRILVKRWGRSKGRELIKGQEAVAPINDVG
jgi:hypothetical protein